MKLRHDVSLSSVSVSWEVFLSSTIRDYEGYRREVSEALVKEAETTCFLSEDWVTGFKATVKECQERVQRASAFLLLLGYWYGSIPPQATKSITHMEFDWAQEKWVNHTEPPVAVFRPHPTKGTAAKELQEAAMVLLPKTKIGKKKHATQLEAFHAEVTNTWHIVRTFEDRQNLLHHVLVLCSLWRGFTLAAAAQGQAQVEERLQPEALLSEAELGRLGRKPQFDAVDSLFSTVALEPEVPAFAMLVSGNEDAGQRAFLQRLLGIPDFRRGRPTRMGRPPFEQYPIEKLIPWTAKVLGLAENSPVQTLLDLAERISRELKRQPLYLLLDQIHHLAGGVIAFQRDFWLPLYQHLQALRTQNGGGHRLMTIVTDYTGDSAAWKDVICEVDALNGAAAYQKLVLLPLLQPFTAPDVVRWLRDVRGIIDDGSGRVAAIAKSVLQNAKGEPDPTPLRVFERLRDESLWAEDEMV